MRGDQALTPAGVRVLDVASELFYRRGINTVGVALIAETAGVTKKTLYDCFGSKANLVVRYLQRRHDRWWASVEPRLADDPDPMIVFDAYLDHPDIDVTRGCAFLNAAAELPADHPATSVVLEHKAVVRERLRELVATGPDAADELFLVLEGATAHRRLGDDERVAVARTIAVRLTTPEDRRSCEADRT